MDKPEVVQQPAAVAPPDVSAASGSAAPGSNLSHNEFWTPAVTTGESGQENRPSDVSHCSI